MTAPLLDACDGGRRLFRVTAEGAVIAVVTAADGQAARAEVVRHGLAAESLTVEDAGHADRTEVTQWGLTDRV